MKWDCRQFEVKTADFSAWKAHIPESAILDLNLPGPGLGTGKRRSPLHGGGEGQTYLFRPPQDMA